MTRALLTAIYTLILGFALYQYAQKLDSKLELEIQNDSGDSTGQLFWRGEEGEFTEERSTTVGVPGGRTSLFTFPLAPSVDAARFDPLLDDGTVIVKRITLASPIPFVRHEWSSKNQFAGVTYLSVESSVLTPAGQRIEAKVDPQIWISDLGPAKAVIRRKLMWALGLVLVGFAALQYWILKLLTRSSSPGAGATAAPREESSVVAGRVLAFFTPFRLYVAALVVVLGGASWIFLAWNKGRRPAAAAAHRFSLVDRKGGALIDQRKSTLAADLGLKVTLDPFMLIRYLPSQTTPGYTINEHGFRETTDRADKRPLLFLLGGSAAFSLGINDEKRTLSARLREDNPGLQVVNAGLVSALSAQELGQMTHYCDAFRPVAYVSFSGWNDFNDQLAPAHAYTGVDYGLFLDIERGVRAGCPSCPEAQPDPAPSFDEKKDPERIARDFVVQLSRMNAFAKSRGAKFRAVIQPEAGNKKQKSQRERESFQRYVDRLPVLGDRFSEAYRAYAGEITKQAKAEGIDVYDMNADPEFQELPDELYVDQVHLNERGAEVAAKLMTKKLQLDVR